MVKESFKTEPDIDEIIRRTDLLQKYGNKSQIIKAGIRKLALSDGIEPKKTYKVKISA